MNLYSRLENLSRYQPDTIAVETPRARVTYAELDASARRIARGLRLAGVVPGDVVGVRLRETPEHVAAFFAVMRVGGIVLPLDWRASRPEFTRVVDQFRPKAILNDNRPPLDWSPVAIDIAAFQDSEPDDEPPASTADVPFAYSLTSGTTGEPKAMVVTHENLLARCTNRALAGVFAADDRYLMVLPLAYPAGREHAACVILMGATLVLYPTLFEPAELVSYVNGKAITAVCASPNAARSLLGLGGERDTWLMPNLRVMVSTTGKLEPEDRAAIRKSLAPHLIDYYGSTGTGPIAAMNRPEDGVEPTSVGHPILGMEIEIADDGGSRLPDGEVGRIRVRGPAMTTRSAGDTAPQDEGYHDGWYYPGDLGRLDDAGLLHLHGRAADLIKRGGLMVHAQEVEQALKRHDSVDEAAVVGAPAPELGQEVVAFVVAKTEVDAKALTQHCRRELAPYKVPVRFLFVDALPRNANGKVVKAKLLAEL